MASIFENSTGAPMYDVPRHRVVTIEHPCIIKNFDNGFRSLGGEGQIKHVIEHRVGDSAIRVDNKTHIYPEPVVGVSLRPQDPLAKKIISGGVRTSNILLKITVPKRTGRKRKRGTNDPFIFATDTAEAEQVDPSDPKANDSNSLTAPSLVRRLRDNLNTHTITPVALLPETHRFRGLPDFQVRSSELPIMRTIREHGVTPNYHTLDSLRVDLTPGPARNTVDYPPPPSFVTLDQPYRYEYQQATGLVFKTDAQGNAVSENMSAPTRRVAQSIPPDTPEIPDTPPADLPPVESLVPVLQTAIAQLRAILQTRPLATRRYLVSALALYGYSEAHFKEATQYAGYSFRAGPFRDSLIRYGVDPRADPKYRFYQTLMFQMDTEWSKTAGGQAHRSLRRPPTFTGTASLPRPVTGPGAGGEVELPPMLDTSHIFDGQHVSTTGKTWQIIDITDPLLLPLIHTSSLRDTCDSAGWGWYHNGTVTKLRIIMKDKMRRILANQALLSDEAYGHVLRFPDAVRSRAHLEETALDEKVVGREVVVLGLEYRAAVGRGAGNTYGRYGAELVDGGKEGEAGKREVEEDAEAGGDDEVDEVDEEDGGDFEALEDEEVEGEDGGEGTMK